MRRTFLATRLVIGLTLAIGLMPPLAAQDAASQRGRIVVRVPATAKLSINGQAMSKTGAERIFSTPALAPGESRRFELTATWREKGKVRTETREVAVKAGARVVVDFTVEAPPEKLTVPPEKSPKRPEPAKTPKTIPKQPPADPSQPRERKFQFTYAVAVLDLKPEQKVRLWIPVAQSSADQDVEIALSTSPANSVIEVDPVYGNRIFSTEGPIDKDGRIEVRFDYRVTRREVKGDGGKDVVDDARLLDRYLEADSRVPIDGKPLELLKDKKLPDEPMAAARMLYDLVLGHMRYSKEGTGWGQGDAVFACENGYGNCSDFHSLFIALARSRKLPAKFEVGFALPEQETEGVLPGYHCWAKFKPGDRGWIPVDLADASQNPQRKDYDFGNLSPHRITFSTGRDIPLVPKSAGPPLNFFVYPYVEVDGKRYTNVRTRFAFKDE